MILTATLELIDDICDPNCQGKYIDINNECGELPQCPEPKSILSWKRFLICELPEPEEFFLMEFMINIDD